MQKGEKHRKVRGGVEVGGRSDTQLPLLISHTHRVAHTPHTYQYTCVCMHIHTQEYTTPHKPHPNVHMQISEPPSTPQNSASPYPSPTLPPFSM